MVVLAAVVQAKPGKENELESLLKSLFPKVKQEEGVVEYVLHRAQDVPGKFFFYEKYRDIQAFEFHMSTPYLKEVFGKFDELLNQQPDVQLYEDIADIAG